MRSPTFRSVTAGANLGNGTDSLVAQDASVVHLGAVALQGCAGQYRKWWWCPTRAITSVGSKMVGFRTSSQAPFWSGGPWYVHMPS